MGLLNSILGISEPEEHRRSHYAGAAQRNEDNRAGGAGLGRQVSTWGRGPARDEEAYVEGYKGHGDSFFDWF